jgi:hypothetical protein
MLFRVSAILALCEAIPVVEGWNVDRKLLSRQSISHFSTRSPDTTIAISVQANTTVEAVDRASVLRECVAQKRLMDGLC